MNPLRAVELELMVLFLAAWTDKVAVEGEVATAKRKKESALEAMKRRVDGVTAFLTSIKGMLTAVGGVVVAGAGVAALLGVGTGAPNESTPPQSSAVFAAPKESSTSPESTAGDVSKTGPAKSARGTQLANTGRPQPIDKPSVNEPPVREGWHICKAAPANEYFDSASMVVADGGLVVFTRDRAHEEHAAISRAFVARVLDSPWRPPGYTEPYPKGEPIGAWGVHHLWAGPARGAYAVLGNDVVAYSAATRGWKQLRPAQREEIPGRVMEYTVTSDAELLLTTLEEKVFRTYRWPKNGEAQPVAGALCDPEKRGDLRWRIALGGGRAFAVAVAGQSAPPPPCRYDNHEWVAWGAPGEYSAQRVALGPNGNAALIFQPPREVLVNSNGLGMQWLPVSGLKSTQLGPQSEHPPRLSILADADAHGLVYVGTEKGLYGFDEVHSQVSIANETRIALDPALDALCTHRILELADLPGNFAAVRVNTGVFIVEARPKSTPCD